MTSAGRRLDTSPLAARQWVFSARRALRRSADGREASCATVRVTIASGDGRALRAAPIRAHLRTCPECRAATPPTRMRSRVAALLPTVPSGLVAALRALVAGPSGESIAAPAKALAVAAVLTVGTGETAKTERHHAVAKRAQASARRVQTTAAPRKPKARTVVARRAPVVTRTVAVRATPVRATPVRQVVAAKPEPVHHHVTHVPAQDPPPERELADAPAPEQEPQAREATARCREPQAPPATSQPAPTPG